MHEHMLIDCDEDYDMQVNQEISKKMQPSSLERIPSNKYDVHKWIKLTI